MTDDSFLVDARKDRNKQKNNNVEGEERGHHLGRPPAFDKVTAYRMPVLISAAVVQRGEPQSLLEQKKTFFHSTLKEEERRIKTSDMQTLHPSTLPTGSAAVTYNPKSESVTLPGGVVSVAGITVVTGGVELSCGSCMLAFGFWGTVIGFSCVGVGVWDQLNHSAGGTSHLLALGLVILALGSAVVVSVAVFHVLTKRRRAMTRNERRDGKEVLVEENVVKRVTV
ncbi:uncharacterized protein LOC129184874 [Dunckerocampus dactyliophorus]|uniref:uncharacterized protein LOC129184874 n=1 Tax=Dunckerocampus dactyliophorus TaxID=161453 RepID=UPI002406C66B|nr:uncharacterized protein LOC129184874 [Dunckerocampus dactyliophorus]